MTEALLAEEEADRWAAEIKEAVEARKAGEERLKENPRRPQSQGLMRRRTRSLTPDSRPSTTPTTRTDTSARA